MPQALQQPSSDDSPVTLDTIYQGLGLDDSTGSPDAEQDTTGDGGEVSGGDDPSHGEQEAEPQGAGAVEAALPQSGDDDVAALRLRHDQLTRTYIPAVERERDRA